MAITLVRQAHAYPGNSAAYPANNTAGNLLVCACSWNDNTSNPTIADTRSNVWTPLTVYHHPSAAQSIKIFYAMNCAAGANTVTVSSMGSDAGITIAEFSGVATTSALGITSTRDNTTGGTTTTPTTSSFTPTAGSLLFMAFADEFNSLGSIVAAGTGWVLLQADTGHTDAQTYKLSAGAGSQTASMTLGSSSSSWNLYLAEFLASGGGGGGGTFQSWLPLLGLG